VNGRFPLHIGNGFAGGSENYIDELLITKKQLVLRLIAVIFSIIIFPFISLGLVPFYIINFLKVKN